MRLIGLGKTIVKCRRTYLVIKSILFSNFSVKSHHKEFILTSQEGKRMMMLDDAEIFGFHFIQNLFIYPSSIHMHWMTCYFSSKITNYNTLYDNSSLLGRMV